MKRYIIVILFWVVVIFSACNKASEKLDGQKDIEYTEFTENGDVYRTEHYKGFDFTYLYFGAIDGFDKELELDISNINIELKEDSDGNYKIGELSFVVSDLYVQDDKAEYVEAFKDFKISVNDESNLEFRDMYIQLINSTGCVLLNEELKYPDNVYKSSEVLTTIDELANVKYVYLYEFEMDGDVDIKEVIIEKCVNRSLLMTDTYFTEGNKTFSMQYYYTIEYLNDKKIRLKRLKQHSGRCSQHGV